MGLVETLFSIETADQRPVLLAALAQLAEGVIVADANGELIYVNAAAAKIHGVEALHVSPEDYSATYHLLTVDEKPHPPRDLPLARAVLDGETIEDAHWKIQRPDGKIIDAIGSATPVKDKNGRQIAAVLTMSDCTDELAADRKLQEALKAKDVLLYEVNHRVKNNLALVTSLLTLHSRKLEDEAARRALSDIASRVTVLADIHRQLYETGTHDELEIVGFLAAMLTDTVKALSGDTKVELAVRQKGHASFGTEEAVPLALALNELVLNSMKHAFSDVDRPEITVGIEVTKTQLLIEYADNGPGFSAPANDTGRGIGRALISALSSQLDAVMEVRSDRPGYFARIEVPLKRD
ncbi:histidine kinase dimerization/phosphoacceptor domain -containing protein [Sphingomicrobium sp. XHP0239]|uniref:sensor histidine kinase n=1 Tax=Sphingomicrobium maritimum TaxID=3133972 RepID=UPI0031CC8332